MKTFVSVAMVLAGSSLALGQHKVDPTFSIDVRPTVGQVTGGPSAFHWYDRDGKYSLATMRMILDNGNLVTFSQRLERVDNSGDIDSLDEYSLERKGEWKIGKQYLPFGSGILLHDSAPALEFDTHILIDDLPISVAVGDAGVGRTRGFSARIGRNYGFSVAYGDHLATQSTSLTPLRPPEDATGRNRGFASAYGLDGRWQFGAVTVGGEYLALRNGATVNDLDGDITDFRLTWRGVRGRTVTEPRLILGWCRSWNDKKDSYRLGAEIGLDRHVTFMPFLRTDGLHVRELGVTTRVRF